MQKREEILNGSLNSMFVKLAIPSIVAGIIVGFYNLVDAVFVGQLVGPEAVAAVSLSYAITLANWSFTFLVGIGSMSLLSRAIGSGRMALAQRIPGNLITVSTIISGMLTVIVLMFARPLVYFAGGSGEILDLGVDYIRIVSLGFMFASVSLGLNLLMRGEGRMKGAMLIVGMSNGTNVLLDYVLMGPLDMGVEGAAIATVVSQFLFMAAMLIYYITNRNGVRMKGIGIATELIGPMVKVGFSGMLMMALMAIQQVFLLRTIGEIGGEDQLIVLGATLRLFTFLPIMAKGVAEGMQPLVGMSTGAGDGERARKALERFTLLGTIAVLVPYAVLMLFPEQVLGAFITDAAILAEGYGHFRLFFSTFVLQVALFTVNYYFIAIGKGKEAGMLVMCRQLFIFVPVTLLLGELMGIIGVWAAVPVCDLLAIALSYMMMKKELSPTVVTFREVAPS